MMNLYITSLERSAGKTAFAISLVALLGKRGQRAAYAKPVSVVGEDDQTHFADADAAFAKEALGLPQDAGVIAPVAAPAATLKDGLGDRRKAIEGSLTTLAGDAGVLVIEGLPASGDTAAASVELAEMANARVVAVVAYRRGMDLGEVVALKDRFGDRLAGVVLNGVPELSMRVAKEEAAAALDKAGIVTLAVVPEDRMLLGFTVADYRERLGGRILNNEEHAGEIVENLLVGAMALDESTYYYERKENKALITRGDRPDLQWNALEGSTRCLILTQDRDPIPYVMNKAEETETPVVVVPKGTLDTVSDIERFVTEPSFHHPQKLARYTELLEGALDLAKLGV